MENVSLRYKLRDNLIGDRSFYKSVVRIILPIIVQNTITNVVNLMDNIMVGRVGTLEMSSVAIVNQLIFVFNLCIFGGISGAGIFATQYAGAKDDDGVRNCFRIKLYIIAMVLVGAISIFSLFPERLIGLYIPEGTSIADAQATLGFATDYMRIMVIGLVPFALAQVYSSSLRELGETKYPMYSSVVAIVSNTVLNFLLIFGMCGFPKLGVEGAAIATVISRFGELALLMFLAHKNSDKFRFLKGAYRSLKIPKKLCIDVLKKGSPILVNEMLWSMGVAMYLQCYSVRGLDVVASANIASTVTNLFNVLFVATGSAVSIMVGQRLGANEIEDAKKTVWRLIAVSFVGCMVIGGVLASLSGVIPQIYNTEPHVKQMATSFLLVTASLMPIVSFTHNCYFTIRSGGKTIITFIFDSGFMWLLAVPVTYCLANYTDMNIVLLYFLANGLEFIKAIIAFILVKKGIWISNIVK